LDLPEIGAQAVTSPHRRRVVQSRCCGGPDSVRPSPLTRLPWTNPLDSAHMHEERGMRASEAVVGQQSCGTRDCDCSRDSTIGGRIAEPPKPSGWSSVSNGTALQSRAPGLIWLSPKLGVLSFQRLDRRVPPNNLSGVTAREHRRNATTTGRLAALPQLKAPLVSRHQDNFGTEFRRASFYAWQTEPLSPSAPALTSSVMVS
jgi:hypothetical protein